MNRWLIFALLLLLAAGSIACGEGAGDTTHDSVRTQNTIAPGKEERVNPVFDDDARMLRSGLIRVFESCNRYITIMEIFMITVTVVIMLCLAAAFFYFKPKLQQKIIAWVNKNQLQYIRKELLADEPWYEKEKELSFNDIFLKWFNQRLNHNNSREIITDLLKFSVAKQTTSDHTQEVNRLTNELNEFKKTIHQVLLHALGNSKEYARHSTNELADLLLDKMNAMNAVPLVTEKQNNIPEAPPPEPGKKDVTEQPVPEPRFRYFEIPDLQGRFRHSAGTDEPEAGKSVYCFETDETGNMAFFSILPAEDVAGSALINEKRNLQPVCIYTNKFSQKTVRIVTEKKGEARREGEYWIVNNDGKAHIRFE